MHVRSILFSLLATLLIFGNAMAQSLDCPAFLQAALTLAAEQCAEIESDEACYGNPSSIALDIDEAPLSFGVPGETVPIEDIRNLATSALNVEAQTWGIALLNIQADLTAADSGQNATFVLFGDAEIEQSALADLIAVPAQLTSNSRVRAGAGTNFAQIGSLINRTDVTLIGRTADNLWVQIEFPEAEDSLGWISTGVITSAEDISILPIIVEDDPYGAPLQAFRLRTAEPEDSAQPCAEAPAAGVLIQIPSTTSANFLINGVEVTIAGTVVIRRTDEILRLVNIAGSATIGIPDGIAVLSAGEAISLYENNTPSEINTYTLDEVQGLPFRLLPEAVAITPVITNHFMPPTTVNPDSSPVQVSQFIDFVDGDGDGIVEVRGTFVGADTFNDGTDFVVDQIELFYNDDGNPNEGTIKLGFMCTFAAEATWDLVIVDAAGNISPPFSATYSCVE